MPRPKSARHLSLLPERSRTFAERVRQARESAEVTQQSVAHKAGVTVQHIRRLEGGTANPTLATIYAIGDALNVDVRTFVTGVGQLAEPDLRPDSSHRWSEALARDVRNAREAADATQEWLAQAAGIGVRHIRRIEQGTANPTLATLYAISDVLGVDVRRFMTARSART